MGGNVCLSSVVLSEYSEDIRLEWFVLLAAIPVFAIIHVYFLTIAKREYKPYIATHKSLAWARWGATLIMALGYVLLLMFTGENHQHESFADAIHEGIYNSNNNDGWL